MAVRTRSQAITIAVIALMGALGAAAINVLPSFCSSKKEVLNSKGVSVSQSTVGGSVVGGNQDITQNITYNISVVYARAGQKPSEEDAKQMTAGLLPRSIEGRDRIRAVVATIKAEVAQVRPSEQSAIKDTAYRTASEFAKLGFYFSPTNNTFMLRDHDVAKVLIPTGTNTEYVIVVVGSQTIGRLRAALYDETGQLLHDSQDSDNRSTYFFRTQYSGTAQLFLEASDVAAPSSLVCLIGRRGDENEDPNIENKEIEPTFETDEDSKPPEVAPSITTARSPRRLSRQTTAPSKPGAKTNSKSSPPNSSPKSAKASPSRYSLPNASSIR